jgi:hypothetical protein
MYVLHSHVNETSSNRKDTVNSSAPTIIMVQPFKLSCSDMHADNQVSAARSTGKHAFPEMQELLYRTVNSMLSLSAQVK